MPCGAILEFSAAGSEYACCGREATAEAGKLTFGGPDKLASPLQLWTLWAL